jgi:2-iminobutanoate/2-iminopropanoate deaminase
MEVSWPLHDFFEVYGGDRTCLVPLGVQVDGLLIAQGLSAPGLEGLEAQARACLEGMRELVERAGASLDSVGRAVCYVEDASQRDAVYALWDEMFPDLADRPAFKVLTGPLPQGFRVRLDVLALPGAWRQRIDIEGVEARDPTVLAGDWLFTSRLHAIDPATGGSPEGLRPQVERAVANVNLLAGLAGDRHKLSQVLGFARDSDAAAEANRALRACLPEADVAIEVLRTWVRPSAQAMVEAIAIASGEAPAFRELFIDPAVSNQADGFRYGDFVFAGSLRPEPGAGAGVEAQYRSVLEKTDRLLAVAGARRGEVARVTFYMRDLDDRRVLNQVWSEWFPDPLDRPPHTYLPASLPDGQVVALQVIALAGAKRRVLAVPGVEHGDPMSLAALTGNLLFSSRIFGRVRGGPEVLDAHTADCFETAAELLSAAGNAEPRQITAFASSSGFSEAVAAHAGKVAGKASLRLTLLETDLGRGVLLPRLQVSALVPSDTANP